MRTGFETPTAPRLVVAAIVVLTLSYGRPVLMPLALASVVAFMLSPIVGWLTRRRLPRTAVVALVMIAFLGGTLIASTIFSNQVLQLTASLSTYRGNVAEKMKTLVGGAQTGALKRAVDSIDALQREVETQAKKIVKDDDPIRVVLEEPPATGLTGVAKTIASSLGPLEMLILTLVYAAVLLGQKYDVVDRLVRLAGEENLTEATSALAEAGARISRLFLAQSAINALFGAVVGVGLWLIGIPNAALWGMATAVLRFIPWVGIVLAAIPPLLLAAAVTPGWGLVLATLALFVFGELVLANAVEPLLLGRHSGLSPLAVIAAASFWSVLWGPIGLMLAAPLTVALVVLGDYVPALRFVSLLLGDRPPLSPAQEYYRRLLSDDCPAAADRFEREMEERAPADVCEKIVLPALAIAAQEYRDGRISDNRAQEIDECMKEVEELIAPVLSDRSDTSDETKALRIIIPAHGPFDRIAARFAAFLLSRLTGVNTIAAEQGGMLALASFKSDNAIETLLIVTVGGVSKTHMRLLARRAATDFPNARLLHCDWSGAPPDEKLNDKSLPGLVVVCTSFAQAARLLHFQATESSFQPKQ